MRYIPRQHLSAHAQKYLKEWTEQLEQVGALSTQAEQTALRATVARQLWRQKARTRVVHEIRATLVKMNGRLDERCMYCEYSIAKHIDHFEPITRNPLRTFDWTDHILGCDRCNSNEKRSRFEGPNGEHPIDPTAEDPRLHLQMLPIGKVRALTPRGEWSRDLFGLEEPLLVKLRRDAWTTLTTLIPQYASRIKSGQNHEAAKLQEAILNHPFVSVLAELLAISRQSHASILIPLECRVALQNHPEIYTW